MMIKEKRNEKIDLTLPSKNNKLYISAEQVEIPYFG